MSSNEPAFPLNELNQTTGDICAQHFGITLRDYFAAKAMLALASADSDFVPVRDADVCYEVADAMLKAREA